MNKIDILEALRLMRTACPVHCTVNLTSSDEGNLILVWRWRVLHNVQRYSFLLIPDEIDDHTIHVAIDVARKEIKQAMSTLLEKAKTGQTTNKG